MQWLVKLAIRLNVNNLIFPPRRITQEANFLVTENTGQYCTTEGYSEKGKIVNIN